MGKQDEFFKTQIRVPTVVYGAIKDSAEESGRSINSEMIYLFQVALGEMMIPISEERMEQIVRNVVRDELKKKGKE